MKPKIIIVNENDEIIDYKDRNSIKSNDIYRVSALWIKNSKGEFLLAKRAISKKHDPGGWGPAVAGTVEKDESYYDNIIKEAEEELGIKDIKPIIGPKLQIKGEHNFFVQWYIIELNRHDFKINKEEVSEIKWFSKDEFLHMIKLKSSDFLEKMKDYFEIFK